MIVGGHKNLSLSIIIFSFVVYIKMFYEIFMSYFYFVAIGINCCFNIISSVKVNVN